VLEFISCRPMLSGHRQYRPAVVDIAVLTTVNDRSDEFCGLFER